MGNCNCSANMLDDLKNNQIILGGSSNNGNFLCNNPCGQPRREHEFDFSIGVVARPGVNTTNTSAENYVLIADGLNPQTEDKCQNDDSSHRLLTGTKIHRKGKAKKSSTQMKCRKTLISETDEKGEHYYHETEKSQSTLRVTK